MKQTLLKIAGVLAATLGAATASVAAPIQGDYVEARTASVFAGPCHYSGEYMSDGRDAVLAWHVAKGDFNGVSLAGLNAVAVVRSDDNLGDKTAQKSAKLYIDSTATAAQRAAMVAAIQTKCGDGLGTVASVDDATIKFRKGADIVVDAPGVASLDIAPMPNRECCKQPSLVWYKPLAPVDNRLVGFTKVASCTNITGGDAWSRSDENSAFYGTFKF